MRYTSTRGHADDEEPLIYIEMRSFPSALRALEENRQPNMNASWKLLVLWGLVGSRTSTELFTSPGDVMIGGLFPINELTSNLSQRRTPEDIQCRRVNSYGLSLSLVLKFSVDQINSKPDLLPGVRLGFWSFDTCMQPAVVMRPVLQLLTEESSDQIQVSCNYTHYRPRVMAIIGPNNSELVPVIGKLIGFFLMPMISYGATSDDFSDKQAYPSFMRTVPSDRWQAEAMVQLLLRLGWNWVSVVGSDDEYGQRGQQLFSSMANDQSICIAYQGFIPMYTDPGPAIRLILSRIVEARVGVVVVFSLPNPVRALFTEVIRQNLSAVWVASTAWALSDVVSALPGVASVGTVLGFADVTRPLPQLVPYVQRLLAQTSGRPEEPCPSCSLLTRANASLVETRLVQRTAFSVYAAIYCVAQALHQLLECNATRCRLHPTTDPVYPWQLLERLRQVSLDLEGIHLQFDKEGNPNFGYDVIQWIFEGNVSFNSIGNFYQNLSLMTEQIFWNTQNSTVPVSTCSSDCETGQVRRVKGFHSCCFDCIDCKEGTFLNNSDDIQCTACPAGQWSSIRSSSCVEPVYSVLDWGDGEALVLMLGGALLLTSHAWVGGQMWAHRGSALVRGAGGALGALALISLSGQCVSLMLFLSPPGDAVCRLQEPLNAFCPTVALSIILSISLQILSVSEFPESSQERLEKLRGRGSWCVVLGCCGLQAGLCVWFASQGPSLSQYVSGLEVHYITSFLRCPVEPMLNLGLMLGFNVLLALLSFMSTFMALKPPGQYNLARDITVSTLSYCVMWVMFIPVYTSLGERHQSVAQVAVSLMSNLGLVAAYFFPKCHLLVKHPELNTLDHFRTFLEGVPPTDG